MWPATTYRKFRGRYRGYRQNHGRMFSFLLAQDVFFFVIVYPSVTGTAFGLYLIGAMREWCQC